MFLQKLTMFYWAWDIATIAGEFAQVVVRD